ncbi:MAG: acyl-CoA thioesterase, partial [Planctomycetaceae bacterium]
MNWLVFHVLSGQAFFTGVALIVVAALASRQSKPIARRITALAFLIGVIAITISSTAIPYWYYAVALVVTIAWFASHYVKTWRRWSAFAVVAVWLMAAVLEIPFHITPTLTPARSRSIT